MISGSFKKLSSLNLKSKILLIIFIFFLVAIPLFLSTKRESNKQASTQIQSLVASLSKIVELPNETPTVATVSDVSKLSGQAFFAKAQNGDKVLVFQKAGKAYLFRPSTGKLIEVAFSNPEPTKAVAGASTSATPSPTTTPTSVPNNANLTPTASPSGIF